MSQRSSHSPPAQPQPLQNTQLESPPAQPQPLQNTQLESPPTQPQPLQTTGLESPPVTPVPVVARQNMEQRNPQWQHLIFEVCLTSALAIALQSTKAPSQLPLSFHLLSLTVILSFSTLFVAKLISSKYPVQAQVVEKAAVFFLFTAFFLAISISMPLSLKIFTWAMYVVLLLTVFVLHFMHLVQV